MTTAVRISLPRCRKNRFLKNSTEEKRSLPHHHHQRKIRENESTWNGRNDIERRLAKEVVFLCPLTLVLPTNPPPPLHHPLSFFFCFVPDFRSDRWQRQSGLVGKCFRNSASAIPPTAPGYNKGFFFSFLFFLKRFCYIRNMLPWQRRRDALGRGLWNWNGRVPSGFCRVGEMNLQIKPVFIGNIAVVVAVVVWSG